MKITRVISGEFSGSTFQFAVHSPAQSGLEKGRAYTIKAVWKDHGYIVDEDFTIHSKIDYTRHTLIAVRHISHSLFRSRGVRLAHAKYPRHGCDGTIDGRVGQHSQTRAKDRERRACHSLNN